MTDLAEWLTERKIDEVECLVPDINGIARGKILPATKFIKSARDESLRLPESIFIQTVTGEYSENQDYEDIASDQDPDIYLKPDADTLPAPAAGSWDAQQRGRAEVKSSNAASGTSINAAMVAGATAG